MSDAIKKSEIKKGIDQARLKVDRAYRHRAEVEHEFAEYLKTDFCRLIEETDSKTGGQQFRLSALEPVPSDMVLAIGDSFHCLNCALDYLTSGLARAAGMRTDRVHFPTDKDRSQLENTFKPPKDTNTGAPRNFSIGQAFPELCDCVVNKVEAYKGGRLSLWEINRADTIDKHNILMPTITVNQINNILLKDAENDNELRVTAAIQGNGIATFLAYGGGDGAKVKITENGEPSATIRFPDSSEVFAGKPVISTLLNCAQATSETIDLFERTFLKA